MHQSRRQQIVFGARGITTIDITLYGPNHELHSGHYGNWAPNPAMVLARLLASMKDDDGRVLIDHFYDGIEPLSETEKRAIAEAPGRGSRPDAGTRAWPHRRRRQEAGGVDQSAVAQRPRDGSARTGAGASNVIPSSCHCEHRYSAGEGHRSARPRRGA